ncbi:MAG: flagellar biosynthetic protein FliO [Bdellovibrionota bacterium]
MRVREKILNKTIKNFICVLFVATIFASTMTLGFFVSSVSAFENKKVDVGNVGDVSNKVNNESGDKNKNNVAIDSDKYKEDIKDIADENILTNKEKLENVKKIVDKKNKDGKRKDDKRRDSKKRDGADKGIKSKDTKKDFQDSSEDPINMYGMRMLRALGLVIGLLLVMLAIIKKTTSGKNQIEKVEKIKILEKKNLNAKSILVLAKVESKKVLIGISGESISMINLEDDNSFKDLLGCPLDESVDRDKVSDKVHEVAKNKDKKSNNETNKKVRQN